MQWIGNNDTDLEEGEEMLASGIARRLKTV